MIKRLDNIGVAVRDAAKMHAFYETVPGFNVSPLRGTEFSVGIGDLSLYVFQTSGVAGDQRSTDYLANPRGLDHLAFEVADIDAASRDLEGRGFRFEHETVGAPGEFRYRGFKDPEGNMLYIIQHGS